MKKTIYPSSYVTPSSKIQSSEYDPSDYEGGYTEWDLVDTKYVRDFDGFMTDYTLWYNQFEDVYICVFGDRDIYYPENSDWDAEFESYEEAREWFDDYVGADDEESY